MQVILFEIGGARFALKLEAVERILGPGESAPVGRRIVDLARLLELDAVDGAHLALLSGCDAALAIGRPTGSARIDPAWIIPLPGYIFRVARPPFRGLIDVPPGRKGNEPGRAALRGALLLDAGTLVELSH